MTARSCEDMLDRLVEYADGELSESDAADVAEHEARCDRCHELLEALRRSLAGAQAIWADGEAALADLRPEVATVPRCKRAIQAGRRRVALLAGAAALLIAVGTVWHVVRERPPAPARSPQRTAPDALRRQVAEVAIAAQLLMAADLLAEQPGGEELACKRYRYVLSAYPETEAAAHSRARLASLCDERVEP